MLHVRSAPLRPGPTVGLVALLLVGCARDSAPVGTQAPPPWPDGVLARLAGSDGMRIFALHPRPEELAGGGALLEDFHGYPILGQATVPDPSRRDLLLRLLEDGIEASDGSAAHCFEPRHGLSVTAGSTTVDYVICFECRQIQVVENGQRQPDVLTSDAHAGDVTRFFEGAGLVVHSDG
jgi:hypothetical protein